MTLQLSIEAHPAPTDLKVVEDGLVSHAVGAGIEARNHTPLAIFLRNEAGVIAGGLAGATVWGWLHISQLWVTETYRNHGNGDRLLKSAEDEAVRRGCHGAYLDTFDFQALAFYQKRGYVVFGQLQDFSQHHVRYFLKKRPLSSVPGVDLNTVPRIE